MSSTTGTADRAMLGARLSVETVAAIAVLALVAFVFLNVNAKNPPGFNRDEAAIAYNAYTLSSSGEDEYGAHFPLFIRSFNDYKSPLYVYLLAGVFRVTGPSTEVARTFSAVLGLAAVLVMYILALAISRRQWLALGVTLLAGLSPWLFETSRVVFEVALMPLLIALMFLVVYRAHAGTWRLPHSLAVGVLLAAMVYTYQVGRVVAPLFALALALCWYRQWRQIAVVWLVFLVAAVVPLGIWAHLHPHALQARYHGTTYIVPGMSTWEVVVQYLRHYVNNLNLWGWATHGDSDNSDHVQGDGSLLFVECALAIAGIVIVLLRRRSDLWWRFVLLSVLISPTAAAVTVGAFDTRRLVVLAVALPLLAIPALESIAALPVRKARVIFAGVLILFVVEAVNWQVVFLRDGPKRLWQFDSASHALIANALRQHTKLYAFRGDHAVYIHMLFDGTLAGRSPASMEVLDGAFQRPPPGAHVLGNYGECPQCPIVMSDSATSVEEYLYQPARSGAMRTNFQLTSPLRGVGQPLDFTVWIDNLRAKPIDHILLTIKLPPTMHLTGPPYYAMGYGCTHGQTIVCNIGYFPGHTSTVVRYEVIVDQGGPQSMTAKVTTDRLEDNPATSGKRFTVDLSPPAYARSSRLPG